MRRTARRRLAVLGIVGAWMLLSAVPAEGHKLNCDKTRLLAAEFAVEHYGDSDPRAPTRVKLEGCLGGPTTKDRRGKKHRHIVSWSAIAEEYRLDLYGEGTGYTLVQTCRDFLRVYQGKGELKAAAGSVPGRYPECISYIPG